MPDYLTAQAPAVLPPQPQAGVPPRPPMTPLPPLPPGNGITIGEVQSGDAIMYGANGQVCHAPMVTNGGKLANFLRACPPEKFLADGHPECSCKSFLSMIDDFAALRIKVGNQYHGVSSHGTVSAVLMVTMLLVVLTIACAPAVYYLSYRMSRRELAASAREGFFIHWHQQRMSAFICLIMICFGFGLLLLGVTGASEIAIGDLKISTSLPGIVFAMLGFVIWRMTLRRRPYQQPSNSASSEA